MGIATCVDRVHLAPRVPLRFKYHFQKANLTRGWCVCVCVRCVIVNVLMTTWFGCGLLCRTQCVARMIWFCLGYLSIASVMWWWGVCHTKIRERGQSLVVMTNIWVECLWRPDRQVARQWSIGVQFCAPPMPCNWYIWYEQSVGGWFGTCFIYFHITKRTKSSWCVATGKTEVRSVSGWRTIYMYRWVWRVVR